MTTQHEFNEDLCRQVREGKLAIEHNSDMYNIKNLLSLSKHIFPNSEYLPDGSSKFYLTEDGKDIDGFLWTTILTRPVSDFFVVEDAAVKNERSKLYNKILSVVKKLNLKETNKDSFDHTSIAYELEQLFNQSATTLSDKEGKSKEYVAHEYAVKNGINGVDYKLVKRDFLAGFDTAQQFTSQLESKAEFTDAIEERKLVTGFKVMNNKQYSLYSDGTWELHEQK